MMVDPGKDHNPFWNDVDTPKNKENKETTSPRDNKVNAVLDKTKTEEN